VPRIFQRSYTDPTGARKVCSTFSVEFWAGGKRYVESSGETTRTAANKFLGRRLAEVAQGNTRPRDAEKVLFEDLYDLIVADYAAQRRRSLRRVRSAFKHLRTWFGSDRAVTITPDRLTQYVAARNADGASPATVRMELTLLRRAFRLAVDTGRLPSLPKVPKVVVKNARTGFFEAADLAALLIELPDYLRPVAEFAAVTGWRVLSEVLPLTWDRVDFTAGVVRLDMSKNGEAREIPFSDHPTLKRLLEQQRERALGPFVFHRKGSRIRNYYGAWRSACKRAGCDGRYMHDFRRTAVRGLERAGVSRSVAMQITGHKTESVYRRYAIVAAADLREGMEKLARAQVPTAQEAP
jgi:integrase